MSLLPNPDDKGGARPTLDKLSMIDAQGGRRYIHPADSPGRFHRWRTAFFAFLITLYLALPFISIGGQQAMLIDIPGRRFYFFGASFNAQDFYLAFFILSGIGFGLIVLSALWGRLWCGWACPQTVFLEGVFRRVERWIEGDRNKRIRLDKREWDFDKVWRKSLKHVLYFALSAVIAHTFLAYFVGREELFAMVGSTPGDNAGTFTWAVVLTGIFYFNFFWFREQLCIIICPYGRLQSVLGDRDTMVIGYDANRGEPRGKAKDPNAGDCIDCGRCIAVCPTGIDIRHGLQLECIGCARCIDACDTIMDKLDRPRGLVRYDSERGLEDNKRRFWRPRVFLYSIAGLAGLTVATFWMTGREHFATNVLRPQKAPYTLTNEGIRNELTVHVTNKQSDTATFTLTPEEVEGVKVTLPLSKLELKGFAGHQFPVVLDVKKENYKKGMRIPLVVDDGRGEPKTLKLKFLGPRKLK